MLTKEEITEILSRLHLALASRTEAAGTSRIKLGDLEVEYDVREITRLINYYEDLLARLNNRTTIIKGLDLGNAH